MTGIDLREKRNVLRKCGMRIETSRIIEPFSIFFWKLKDSSMQKLCQLREMQGSKMQLLTFISSALQQVPFTAHHNQIVIDFSAKIYTQTSCTPNSEREQFSNF